MWEPDFIRSWPSPRRYSRDTASHICIASCVHMWFHLRRGAAGVDREYDRWKAGLRRKREAIANVNLYVHGGMGKRNKRVVEQNNNEKKKNMETGSTDHVDERSGGRGGRGGRDKPELGGCVPAGARAEVNEYKKIGKRAALPLVV